MNTEEVYNAIISGTQDYFKKNNFKRAVIGLSGGIDSSVACCLAVKSLGNKNVTALLMPDLEVTSKENMDDAENIAKKLKIKYHIIPLNDIINVTNIKKINNQKNSPKENFFADAKIKAYALANMKARIRMIILYYFANLKNALVIGTSDKSEIALGYTTKYGDNAADIMVIGDLWKTEIIEIGRFLGIPFKILNKNPSAELMLGVTAEKELGADYELLDKILKMHIEEDSSMQEIISKGLRKNIVKKVMERIRLNEHKRRNAILIRVSERSFHSIEWRMPITNGFRG